MEPMISDNETNKVYFSNQSTYDFKPELKELIAILDENGIEYGFINGTRDYFCRDYMPVQIDEDTVVRFKFRPDYLLNDPLKRKYVTNTSLVYRSNDLLKNFRTIESDIILDGGNVVKCKSKVIITGRVLTNNPDKITTVETRRATSLQTSGLSDAFPGVKIIIIPRYPNEPTGHADGLVRS
jgi:agmatine deiminase